MVGYPTAFSPSVSLYGSRIYDIHMDPITIRLDVYETFIDIMSSTPHTFSDVSSDEIFFFFRNNFENGIFVRNKKELVFFFILIYIEKKKQFIRGIRLFGKDNSVQKQYNNDISRRLLCIAVSPVTRVIRIT